MHTVAKIFDEFKRREAEREALGQWHAARHETSRMIADMRRRLKELGQ